MRTFWTEIPHYPETYRDQWKISLGWTEPTSLQDPRPFLVLLQQLPTLGSLLLLVKSSYLLLRGYDVRLLIGQIESP